MIVGNGDIAKAIKDREHFLFFASGVSNSRETRESEYNREVDLLLSFDKSNHVVYFSSLCVFYSDSRYARHKRYMEKLVKGFDRWTIIRIGNITWGTNPHTIINYLRDRYKRGEKLKVKNVYRYLLDKDEFIYWLGMIPDWNCEMNLTGRKLKVKDIVNEYIINNHTKC